MSGKPNFNWPEIQARYDSGKRPSALRYIYGFSKSSWTRAVDSGRIRLSPKRMLQKSRIKETIVGRRFNGLTVTGITKKPKLPGTVWVCVCDCGSSTTATRTELENGRKKSCGCLKLRVSNNHPLWSGFGEISGRDWTHIIRAAKARNLPFLITIEEAWLLFKKQNGICALSGQTLSFGKTWKDVSTASLDRIDSSKGYTIDNVQWLHKWVNIMKWDFSESEFLDWIKQIYEYNELSSQNNSVAG